jgi:acetolactate decarboxylase
VARDVIDDRLLGALHLRALTRAGLAHDAAEEHTAFQAGTLDALMAGRFDGETTLGELLAHGDLGIGTVQHLGGELVILDGEPWLVDADGGVHAVPHSTPTPFAVLCHFAPTVRRELTGPLEYDRMREQLDAMAPPDTSVLAVRIDGSFGDLRLRSVHAQVPPYPKLSDVVEHQTEWSVPSATGSIVGFRFPDATAGVEVPGYHLHFLSDDRTVGGHVLDLTMVDGRAALDPGDELHVELDDGVGLGVPGAADRAEIARLEGGS